MQKTTRREPRSSVPAKMPAASSSPALMVVVDHHEAKVYHVGEAASESPLKGVSPRDPHHFLHHLTHKDQSREQGQRAPEESSFYKEIAAALAGSAPIIVVGHGKGKSNAAHHLTDFLRSHDPETFQRIFRQLDVDLSSVTTPELMALARSAIDLEAQQKPLRIV